MYYRAHVEIVGSRILTDFRSFLLRVRPIWNFVLEFIVEINDIIAERFNGVLLLLLYDDDLYEIILYFCIRHANIATISGLQSPWRFSRSLNFFIIIILRSAIPYNDI